MNNGTTISEQAPGVNDVSTMHILTNAVLFQLCWFTAVLAGGYWALFPLLLMLLHYCLVKGQQFLLTLLALSFFGIVFDSLYLYLNVYQFPSAFGLPILGVPLWLVSLWLAFCLCLPLSLAWLVKKPYFFVLACSILGPLSYLAGRKLQALDFTDPDIGFLVLEWCIFSFLVTVLLLPGLSKPSEPHIKLRT